MLPIPARSLAIVVGVVAISGSVRPAGAQNFPPPPLAVAAGQNVLDRRLPSDVPPMDVKTFPAVAASLAIPFGFEEADALAARVSSPFSVRTRQSVRIVSVRPRMVDVRGITLRQALDALVAVERRYAWRDVDGVVVVRPASAWEDAGHPLHRPATALHLEDARAAEAFEAVRRSVNPPSRRSAEAAGDEPRLTVDFSGGTLFELLNALARSHGRLQWSLTSKAEMILLDGARAVDAFEPLLSLGADSGSMAMPFTFASAPR